MTETQPVWVLLLKIVVVVFAITGVFSSLMAFNQWNQEHLLHGENSISENVTVVSAELARGGYVVASFIASNEKGYVMSSVFGFSRIDPIIVGHPYSIKYFCNPLDSNRRTIMEAIDLTPTPYECVATNGVCS